MPSGVDLFLVRHGQTEWNREHRLQGQMDSPLTELGCAQAVAVGRRLAERPIARLVASDLGRTRRTAELVAGELGVSPAGIEFDAGWRERHLGRFQGRFVAELSDEDFLEYQQCRTGDPAFVPHGGESRRQLQERGVAAMRRAAASVGEGKAVLVVAHGGVMSSVLRHVLGVPMAAQRAFSVKNCAFNHLVIREGAFEVATMGDTSHLGADSRTAALVDA